MEGQSDNPQSTPSQQPPQACPVCQRCFDRAEHLKRHLATHTNERNRICRVCGRKFSRKDALDRHQSVHRPRVPLRRFRACVKCAASRVKCSGAPPCTRCEKKSLACVFPEGSENDDVSTVTVANKFGGTSSTRHESVQHIDPSAAQHGAHDQFIMASQQQQQQQQQFPRQQHGFPGAQDTRPETYSFMQQAMGSIQPVGLMSTDTTATHMISTLNWLSPTMDFDLADFDYNQVASNEQYWSSAAAAADSQVTNDLTTDQSPLSAQLSSGPVDHPSSSSPATFQGDGEDAELPGKAYVDNKGARQPRNGRYANRIFSEAAPGESPRSYFEPPVISPETDGFTLMPPHVPDLYHQKLANIHVQPFTAEQYQMLCQHFHDYCLAPRSTAINNNGAFYPAELPSISVFTILLKLYRKNFDPKVLPIIHHEFLDAHDSRPDSFSWIVKLAMAAIGSQYLETTNTELAVALQEFLRRILVGQRRAAETLTVSATVSIESLALVQAKLLNYIGLAYSGARRLEAYRAATLEDLLAEHKLLYQDLSSRHYNYTTMPDGTDFATNTLAFMLPETMHRLCHAIWLVETMAGYHSPQTQPKLLLDYANIALPCKEDVWQMPGTTLSPLAANQAPPQQPTLEKAIRVLYIEKRLLPDTGDFARVLIIHGLYCHTWEVARSLNNRPLLRWTPSAQKGNAESVEMIFGGSGSSSNSSGYNTGTRHNNNVDGNDEQELGLGLGLLLPQIPLYNHWRNATCDCLDVLHWIANSDIAKTGTENSTVLHLHFARIVLLAPYDTIRELAELLTTTAADSEANDHSSEDIGIWRERRRRKREKKVQEYRQRILKWITEDQFKARLALIHCGVLFWHVRRYATDAFYEPGMVFLATLVVWAYGSVCPPQQQQQQQQFVTGAARASSFGSIRSADRLGRGIDKGQEEEDEDEDEEEESDVEDISSIRLDRPTDDELVQIFIKRGRSMTATIMGVGNITGPKGPLRMLREGCKLLNTLDKWLIRYQYLDTLTRLMGTCRQGRDWLANIPNGGQIRQ